MFNSEIYRQLLALRKELCEHRQTQEYMLVSENGFKYIDAKSPINCSTGANETIGEVKNADFGAQLIKFFRNYLGENELFS